MEFAVEGALLLCSSIYENAVSASNNICLCEDLANHVQGIQRILINIKQDIMHSQNYDFPQSLIHSLEYLKAALDQANRIIERYGKRGRILRYILATKVKAEFENAFLQIDLALQQLGAINMYFNAESKRSIHELSQRVHQMSYNLTQDMENINKKMNLIFQKQESSNSNNNSIDTQEVQDILFQIPGRNTHSEQLRDIEDLKMEMEIAIAEKKQAEALMIQQIISVLQELSKKLELENVPPAIFCPITQEVMRDPVMIFQTGQTYERTSIEHWFQLGNKIDPVTQIELHEQPIYQTNYALKSVIDYYSHFEIKGIQSILISVKQDMMHTQNCDFPQSLIHSLEFLKSALDQANRVIERYGKRGRILRYILATKVKAEFESAFLQIDQALQQLGAVNMYFNAESKRSIQELSQQVHQMSYNLTQDMENINKKINLIFQNQESSNSHNNSIDAQEVQDILVQIPGQNTHSEQLRDIEDLKMEMEIAITEKKQGEALMFEQIISVLQELSKKPELENVPSAIFCPITQEVMRDPVMIFQTGQTYERTSIEHRFQLGNKIDPVTQIELHEQPIYQKNFALKSVIDYYSHFEIKESNSSRSTNVEDASQDHNSHLYSNNVDLEDGRHVTNVNNVAKRWGPVWLWVIVNIIIIFIIAAVVVVTMLVTRKNGLSSQLQGQDGICNSTELELPICSTQANPLKCDKDVLRKLHNRPGDPCWDWGDAVQCTYFRIDKIYKAFYNIPKEISRLDGLKVLDFNGSQFEGERLPEEWSTLTNLISFRAKEVDLSGPLPPEYSVWTNIKIFSVGGNYIKTTIPQEFSTWKNAMDIGLRLSQFKGTLPPQFSTLTNLEKFYVFDNFLKGTLPPQYSNWKNINNTQMERNQFNGSIPKEYTNFNGYFSVKNLWGYNHSLCIENGSVLIEKFNTNSETGDFNKLPLC